MCAEIATKQTIKVKKKSFFGSHAQLLPKMIVSQFDFGVILYRYTLLRLMVQQ